MADPYHSDSAADPTNLVKGAADQQNTPDLVKKVTHEVDTDDMFVQGGE
ncbi:MAG TPA: hypothetical protein VF638_05275 [Sphingomonas sp.]|jgi:hypothetical protein